MFLTYKMLSKKRKYSGLDRGSSVSRFRTVVRYKDAKKTKKKVRISHPYKFYVPSSVPETKAFDFWDNTGGTLTAYGSVAYAGGADAANAFITGYTCINRIPQGSAVSQRIGTKITMKHISALLYFNSGTEVKLSNTNLQNCYRIMLLYDKSPNGTAPDLDYVLAATGQAGTEVTDRRGFPIIGQLNNRFIWFKDEFMQPDMDTPVKIYHWEIDCNLQAVFNGTDSPMTIDKINSGAIYLIAYNVYGTNTNPYYFSFVKTRVYFTDP